VLPTPIDILISLRLPIVRPILPNFQVPPAGVELLSFCAIFKLSQGQPPDIVCIFIACAYVLSILQVGYFDAHGHSGIFVE
jgi:hypothetical protein